MDVDEPGAPEGRQDGEEGRPELRRTAPPPRAQSQDHNRTALRERRQPPVKRNWTWLAVVLLFASIYLFWVLPYQLGSRPVQVEFTNNIK